LYIWSPSCRFPTTSLPPIPLLVRWLL
jgi:hypothetical protein